MGKEIGVNDVFGQRGIWVGTGLYWCSRSTKQNFALRQLQSQGITIIIIIIIIIIMKR